MQNIPDFEIVRQDKKTRSVQAAAERESWGEVIASLPKFWTDDMTGQSSEITVWSFDEHGFRVEIMKMETDGKGGLDPLSISALSETAVLQQPGLRMDYNMEYDEWRHETGLDDSAVGCVGNPGTADIYDAALRIYDRDKIVGIPVIGIALKDEGQAYAGVSLRFPGADEMVVFSEDPAADMATVKGYLSSINAGQVMLDVSLYDAKDAGVLTFRLLRDGLADVENVEKTPEPS